MYIPVDNMGMFIWFEKSGECEQEEGNCNTVVYRGIICYMNERRMTMIAFFRFIRERLPTIDNNL